MKLVRFVPLIILVLCLSNCLANPVPDFGGTVTARQTQTAAPVATMWARLDATRSALATTVALTPLPTSTPTSITGVELLEQETFGDYTVRSYHRFVGGTGFFEIWLDGERVYTREGFRFGVGSAYPGIDDPATVSMGEDITGDGVPNLVVGEWTGGAHCCHNFYVFEIGESFRHLATLNAAHTLNARFVNLDDKLGLEFVMQDWVFAYWRASFAGSPSPEVTLRYQEGEYHLAYDLMCQPAPSSVELSAIAEDIGNHPIWEYGSGPPVELWSQMLDLIYSGHSDLALQFLDMAWPPGVLGKERFVRDFYDQLAESQLWSDLQEFECDS